MEGTMDIHVALSRVWYIKLWVLGVVTKRQFLGTLISLSDAMDQSGRSLYRLRFLMALGSVPLASVVTISPVKVTIFKAMYFYRPGGRHTHCRVVACSSSSVWLVDGC